MFTMPRPFRFAPPVRPLRRSAVARPVPPAQRDFSNDPLGGVIQMAGESLAAGPPAARRGRCPACRTVLALPPSGGGRGRCACGAVLLLNPGSARADDNPAAAWEPPAWAEPTAAAYHEAGHAVVAAHLGVPFATVNVTPDGRGGRLTRGDSGPDPASGPGWDDAGRLAADAAVSAAGAVAEVLFAYPGRWEKVDPLTSAGDRLLLAKAAVAFARRHPGRPWPDPRQAAVGLLGGPLRAAVRPVAGWLQAVGTLTQADVRSAVRRGGTRPCS